MLLSAVVVGGVVIPQGPGFFPTSVASPLEYATRPLSPDGSARPGLRSVLLTAVGADSFFPLRPLLF